MSDSEQEWWQAERYRQYKEALDRRDEQIAMLREVLVPHIADLRATADTIASWREDRLKRTVAEIRKAAGELEAALAATAQPEQDGGWLPMARRLVEAVDALPVEPLVNQDRSGYVELLGYVMKAQGEWDEVANAAAHLRAALPPPPTRAEAEGEG